MAVLLPDILIGVITFEQILPIRVLGLFLFFFLLFNMRQEHMARKGVKKLISD